MVKYFTADEVAMHNCAEDCWVSIFDNVYDLTELLAENKGNFTYSYFLFHEQTTRSKKC